MESHRMHNFFSFLTNVLLHMFYMVNILHKICLPNDLAFLKKYPFGVLSSKYIHA